MEYSDLATDASKTALENSVAWFLADKLQDASTPIATKKFLTNENRLVYLTKCTVASAGVPRIKVQVFDRVAGGVHESGYQLFADHRLVKYDNAMIFGNKPGEQAGGRENQDVTDAEAVQVIALVNSLGQARQTL
jgi:hypothetical protein